MLSALVTQAAPRIFRAVANDVFDVRQKMTAFSNQYHDFGGKDVTVKLAAVALLLQLLKTGSTWWLLWILGLTAALTVKYIAGWLRRHARAFMIIGTVGGICLLILVSIRTRNVKASVNGTKPGQHKWIAEVEKLEKLLDQAMSGERPLCGPTGDDCGPVRECLHRLWSRDRIEVA